MRSLIMFIVLATVGLILIPNVGADNCRAIVQRQRVVVHHHAVQQVVAVKQAVITPIAVAAFTAYPVAVPQYSVGYDAHGGEIQELRKSVKELTKAIQSIQTGTTPQQPTPPPDDLQAKALKVVTNRCAACHTEQTAKGMGGDFILLKGGQFNPTLSTLDIVHAADRAHAGSMPPPKSGAPIPDDEAAVLRALAEQMVKAERQARKAQPNP